MVLLIGNNSQKILIPDLAKHFRVILKVIPDIQGNKMHNRYFSAVPKLITA